MANLRHPDFIQIGTIFGQKTALILDFKSGFLDVPTPEANDQLRAYAVAVWQDPDLLVSQVFASIVPRFKRNPVTVHYSSQDLPMALLDLVEVYRAAQDEAATRIPSVEACRYCRARATSRCPETLYPPAKLKEMPSLIALSPEQKGELLSLCEIVQGNIKALKERLYDELKQDAAAVEGYHLVPGDFRSSIPDAAACYQIVSDMMTAEEFQACLKVGMGDLKGELKDKFRAAENLKAKVAAQRVDMLLAPVTVKKQSEMKLEKKI